MLLFYHSIARLEDLKILNFYLESSDNFQNDFKRKVDVGIKIDPHK